MKKFIVAMVYLCLQVSAGYSQRLSQEVYSSAGGFLLSKNYQISWTIGEVIIDSYFSTNNILTQGFHQPSDLSTIVNEDSVDFFNGFSPNGDGINDYWRIPLLTKNPLNRVIIKNRWGSEVWRNDNYDNALVKFVGKNMNEEDLTDGTYLYEIMYGLILKKGWVFIKR